jgi:uncharacterized protein (DUF427 family)
MVLGINRDMTAKTDPKPRGRIKIEQSRKRVRPYFGGMPVADTIRPVLVWEAPHRLAYYFPIEDVRMDLLTPSGNSAHSPSRGDGPKYTIKVGEREAPDAAWRYEDSPIPELRTLVRFDWAAMDAWFEEDEEVYTGPHDPYSRLDFLASTRHIRIELDGVTVADSHSPRILYETGLPPRYYLPQTDVRLDLLEATDTVTHCPYKGQARYWSARVGDARHEDICWSYPTPLPESQKIAGLIAFLDERADVFVDGVRQEHPKTPFS